MEAHCVSPIRYLATAGALLFIAGVVLLMGILTAETLYPGYSTSGNMICDLGATTPPQSFDATMILSSLLVFVAACLLSRESVDRLFTLLLALLGSGISGVGVFNGSYGTIHALLALFAFLSGGMMCIAAFRVVKAPFPVLSLILGIISLGTLGRFSLMGSSCLFTVLGMGGVERRVAYPIVLWMTGFGGYLLGEREMGMAVQPYLTQWNPARIPVTALPSGRESQWISSPRETSRAAGRYGVPCRRS